MCHYWLFVLAWIAAVNFSQIPPEKMAVPTAHREIVFVDTGWGAGTETALEIRHGQLVSYRPQPTEQGILVGGARFGLDRHAAESRYHEHEALQKLTIQDNRLYFDGHIVKLPEGVRMREVYQGILWKGWVICLGRTSNTDSMVTQKPPFLATELITFNASKFIAGIKFLSSFAPTETRLLILEQ